MITATVKKKGDMKAAIIAVHRKYAARAPEALLCAAELLLEASQEQVPVETGTLKESGRITQNKAEDFNKIVRVGYGGHDLAARFFPFPSRPWRWAAQYAQAVHEIAGKRHPNPEGAKHDFLRDPSNQLQGVMALAIRRIMTR